MQTRTSYVVNALKALTYEEMMAIAEALRDMSEDWVRKDFRMRATWADLLADWAENVDLAP